MFQKILTLSPVIAFFVVSIISFVLGLKIYRSRKEILGIDIDERVFAFIFGGSLGTAIFGPALLLGLVQSNIVLWVLLLCGTILFVIGEWTLRMLIIAQKTYIFSLSIAITGAVMALFCFALLIHMKEPFTLIYRHHAESCVKISLPKAARMKR